MKSISKFLLGAGLFGLCLQPTTSFAEVEAKLFGAITTSFQSTTTAIGGGSAVGSSTFTSDSWWYDAVGVNIKANEKVSGTLELVVPSSENDDVGFKQYFVDADLGFGHLILGSQLRPFAEAAFGADNLYIGHGGAGAVSGPGYDFYQEGVLLSIAAGPVTIKVAVMEPYNPGAADGTPATTTTDDEGVITVNDDGTVKETSSPAIEAGVYFDKSGIVAGVAIHQEDVGVTATKVESAMEFALYGGYSMDKFGIHLAFSSGAPYNPFNVSVGITEGQGETYSGLGLWVNITPISELALSIYYGQETATPDGGTEQIATTPGFQASYDWNGITWLGSAVTTSITNDGQATKDQTTVAAGARFSWGA